MPFDSPPGELLSRYIFHKNRIRLSDKTIKHTVFDPPQNRRLSVYWTSGLSVSEIWQICANYVAPIYGKSAIARADINSLNVYAEDLAIEVTGVPHPRHADIIGWDPESTRTRLQALKLACTAALVESPL